MQYNREDIEAILQSSYYDQRTDYVWKYIMGEREELDGVKFPIPGLESFLVMHEMLKKRNKTLAAFLEEWNTTEHPGLESCSYDEASDTLQVQARSFVFIYHKKLKEFHFEAFPHIAENIGLLSRITHKKYRKSDLFSLSYLVELDEQLFSRYDERQKIKAWRKSSQFEKDIAYCELMIPFIMQDTDKRIIQLGEFKRLNIILSRNDKVRIGIVQDYSPEEMIAMPCYPRSEWQQGITAAFEELDRQYTEEQRIHAIQMKEWSDELTQIALRKTPYNVIERRLKYQIDKESDNQTDDMKPSEQLLDKALMYIVDLSAPLVAYSGPNEIIRDHYAMLLSVDDNDRIKINVDTLQWWEPETFDLEDYEEKFRIWWSQLLLSECKYAKQCALDPEHNNPLYLPF